MGYSVIVSGRVLLGADQEADAVDGLRPLVWRGEPADGPVANLGDLARLFGASASRDGDWLVFQPDVEGDPKWSDRASAFYGTLGQWVAHGEIRVTGEDGAAWSYHYNAGEVTQVGVNGYDGSNAVGIDPAESISKAAERIYDQRVGSGERPPRLRTNSATLCCANPSPTLFGYPAPWTVTMSASPKLPLAADFPTDSYGLFYVASDHDSSDRSASEFDRLISLLETDGESDSAAEIARRARLTRMVVGVTTAWPSFSPEQMDRIVQLQVELDALLIHEEVITYRTSAGVRLSAQIRY